jgi:hypothetical protein
MRQDAVAGTEFQSRLDEDAERRERPDADADDLTAPDSVPMMQMMQQAEAPQVVAAGLQVSAMADAAPETDVRRVRKRQARELLALRFSLELLPPAVQEAPAQPSVLQAAGQLHDDALVQEPQACSRPKRQLSRAQAQLLACLQRDGAVCHRHLQRAPVPEAAARPPLCRGVAGQALPQAQSHVLASRAPTAL